MPKAGGRSKTTQAQPKTIRGRRPSLHNSSKKFQMESAKHSRVPSQNPSEEVFSLQEAIIKLRAPLQDAFAKGYSYKELAVILTQKGIRVSEFDLQDQSMTLEKQTPSKRTASNKRNKTSENSREELSHSDEVLGASKTKISADTRQMQPLEGDAWGVLESLIGTIEAPADWSAEHHHYLYGTPKH
ncbi:MAG: hypothetical protein MUF49_19100 [Oculatellaceae cyanobacterium Prado106]|nr:hypothetical protein [Oculatellaceae cyanobacterium Prado106]